MKARRGYFSTSPRAAFLCLDSFAGHSEASIIVIGETSQHYRITVSQITKLAGRGRWLKPGETTLIPKHAVLFDFNGDDAKKRA